MSLIAQIRPKPEFPDEAALHGEEPAIHVNRGELDEAHDFPCFLPEGQGVVALVRIDPADEAGHVTSVIPVRPGILASGLSHGSKEAVPVGDAAAQLPKVGAESLLEGSVGKIRGVLDGVNHRYLPFIAAKSMPRKSEACLISAFTMKDSCVSPMQVNGRLLRTGN